LRPHSYSPRRPFHFTDFHGDRFISDRPPLQKVPLAHRQAPGRRPL